MQTNRPKRTDTLTDTQADADRYTERQTETDTQCSVKQSKAVRQKETPTHKNRGARPKDSQV